ncbi:MAG TPA: hypothetical protein VK791_05635 [bacterium]|jgi:hypothetical protein|nr:hypothetical protein [bacterium]
MSKWSLKEIEFEEGVHNAMKAFLKENPRYKKILEERINDLLNFPELFWQSAHVENENEGYFATKNQQINLAGKAYKKKGLIVITHFSFHR